MAINRDAAEWFYRPDRLDDIEYGVLKTVNGWLALRRIQLDFSRPEVEVIAHADTREGAIGFLKLLKEN